MKSEALPTTEVSVRKTLLRQFFWFCVFYFTKQSDPTLTKPTMSLSDLATAAPASSHAAADAGVGRGGKGANTVAPASSRAAVPPPAARRSPTLSSSPLSASPSRSATRARPAPRALRNPPTPMVAAVWQAHCHATR